MKTNEDIMAKQVCKCFIWVTNFGTIHGEVLPNCFLPRQTIKVEAFFQWWRAFKRHKTIQKTLTTNQLITTKFCSLPMVFCYVCLFGGLLTWWSKRMLISLRSPCCQPEIGQLTMGAWGFCKSQPTYCASNQFLSKSSTDQPPAGPQPLPNWVVDTGLRTRGLHIIACTMDCGHLQKHNKASMQFTYHWVSKIILLYIFSSILDWGGGAILFSELFCPMIIIPIKE